MENNDWVRYNLGSGQRPFRKHMIAHTPWVNVDAQAKFEPDLCVTLEEFFKGDVSADAIVLHHVLEHFNLEGGEELVRNCHKALNPGGVLYIAVPDLKTLARKWLNKEIDDYIYRVNLYGAYMGDPADTHKWGYSAQTLVQTLKQCGDWMSIKLGYDDPRLADADLAHDDWILETVAVKS